MNLTTESVATSLTQANARWRAAKNPLTSLAPDAQKRMLGAVPSDQVTALMQALKAAPPSGGCANVCSSRRLAQPQWKSHHPDQEPRWLRFLRVIWKFGIGGGPNPYWLGPVVGLVRSRLPFLLQSWCQLRWLVARPVFRSIHCAWCLR